MYLLNIMAAIQVKRSQEIQNQGYPLCFYPAAIWGKSQVPAITCFSCPALVMYQFICYGNRLHLFCQTLSCFCSAYKKHPKVSSSWLFYLPSFFKPELLQPSHPWEGAIAELWGLTLPSHLEVGAVPDSLPPNPTTDLPGRGKTPEGWGMEG